MFLKLAVLLAVVGYAYSQTCLSIVGGCILGQCPKGTCVSNICCVTDPAENCNNTMDDTFCATNAIHCSDPQVGPQLKIQCASTCKSCTTSGATPTTGNCADVAANCAQNANLCSNSVS
uniref:ShKT domain-containing protein n=1 Tax=Panagrolaimus sp. JU765 TaxID=591449 RepID=A0AC34R3G6_9BILA